MDVDDLVAQAESLSKELKATVTDSGSTLMDPPGVGPIVAARVLADVGDVTRFADRNRRSAPLASGADHPQQEHACATAVRR